MSLWMKGEASTHAESSECVVCATLVAHREGH